MRNYRWCFSVVAVAVVALMLSSGLAFAADKGGDLPVVKWRCQSMYPPPETILPDSNYRGGYGQAAWLAREVEKRTNGKFKIEMFTPGLLIKNKGLVDAVRTGAVDMAVCNGAYFSGVIPSANIECMSVGGASDPTVFTGMLTDSDWMKIVRRDYAKYGLHYITGMPAGSSLMMANFEAHSPAELRKYKIAASGAKSDLLKLLGITGVIIHSTDLYPALQRGTVDAIMYSSYCLETYKFHEVVKYAIWTDIQRPTISNITCNLDAYNKLPKAYQDILNNTAMEQALRQMAGTNEIDDIARASCEKHGIKQITFAGEAEKEVRQAILKMWEKYAAMSEDNAQLIKILRSYAGY